MIVLALVLLAAVLYASVIVYYMRVEYSIVYTPSQTLEPLHPDLLARTERVLLASSDGVRLSGCVILADDPAAPWIYFLHGNTGNMTTCQLWWFFIQKLPANLFVLDYRGYGESGGAASEPGIYSDAKAGYDYLLNERSVLHSSLVIYGHSLGTAVAINLASRATIAGLILEGSIISIPARGREMFPFLPVRLITHNRFDSSAKIRLVSCPKLFLHASGDRIIPIHHGRRLYNWASPPKTFMELNGDHLNAVEVDADRATTAVREFLRQIVVSNAVQKNDNCAL